MGDPLETLENFQKKVAKFPKEIDRGTIQSRPVL